MSEGETDLYLPAGIWFVIHHEFLCIDSSGTQRWDNTVQSSGAEKRGLGSLLFRNSPNSIYVLWGTAAL